jgi:hypothetical protein
MAKDISWFGKTSASSVALKAGDGVAVMKAGVYGGVAMLALGLGGYAMGVGFGGGS